MQYLTTDLLKEHCKRIYFFGLGFIQVVVSKEERFHFYHPDLKHNVENIHNHRYDFTSRILRGTITNTVWRPVDGETYQIMDETCRPEDDRAVDTEIMYSDFVQESKRVYGPGASYRMLHTQFHTVEAERCITRLIRSDYKKDLAQVAYTSEGKVACPFDFDYTTEYLWEVVDSMIIPKLPTGIKTDIGIHL